MFEKLEGVCQMSFDTSEREEGWADNVKRGASGSKSRKKRLIIFEKPLEVSLQDAKYNWRYVLIRPKIKSHNIDEKVLTPKCNSKFVYAWTVFYCVLFLLLNAFTTFIKVNFGIVLVGEILSRLLIVHKLSLSMCNAQS